MRWWMWLVLLVVAALLAWRLWPTQRAAAPAPVPADSGVTIQEAAPVEAGGGMTMGQQPLEEVRPEVVSYISQRNGRWVLHFLDGSRRELYPFEIEQLPAQLRLQMGYQREGS